MPLRELYDEKEGDYVMPLRELMAPAVGCGRPAAACATGVVCANGTAWFATSHTVGHGGPPVAAEGRQQGIGLSAVPDLLDPVLERRADEPELDLPDVLRELDREPDWFPDSGPEPDFLPDQDPDDFPFVTNGLPDDFSKLLLSKAATTPR
eukprot:gene41114-50837_t